MKQFTHIHKHIHEQAEFFYCQLHIEVYRCTCSYQWTLIMKLSLQHFKCCNKMSNINIFFSPLWFCVNRRPWVCGISSLGLDHTQILGDTIEKIAWQKGGILKVCWLYIFTCVTVIELKTKSNKTSPVVKSTSCWNMEEQNTTTHLSLTE